MATEELIHSFDSIADVHKEFTAIPSHSCMREEVRCQFLGTAQCTLRIKNNAVHIIEKCDGVLYLTKASVDKHLAKIIT